MGDGKIEFEIGSEDGNIVTISLPDRPSEITYGIVKETVRLIDLIDYSGPEVVLEFDEENRLIGIEILA